MLYRFLPLLALPALAAPTLETQFEQDVKPFLKKNCTGCHGGKTPAAQFDLTAFTTLDSVIKEYPHWALLAERLRAQDMPPKPIPTPAGAQKVIDWVAALRANEIRRLAGDPGLVSARRLSNAEYNYTIRDLTNQNIQPTREFPIDPANPAGFDNSGESLTMSPALLNKYLQAARLVANHMVLQPDRFDFAPHPMLVETDREKFAIQRIISFYNRQPTSFAPYFQAAYRHKTTRKPLATVAAESKVSPKYLPLVWQILNEPNPLGPIAKLQQMFAALTPENLDSKTAEMDAFVTRIRTNTGMQYAAPKVKGLPAGSQPLLNWKLREFALHRRAFDPASLRNDTDPAPVVPTIPRYAGLHAEAAPRWAALIQKARAADPDLTVPAAQRKQYEAAFARFANVFPDKFVITERGRYFPDDSQDKGRLLSAGYHSVVGFYRDDQPLIELILNDKEKAELDRLWNEFDYIAQFTDRTWVQYFFNQAGEVQGKGAESAADRPANHAVTDTEVIFAMRDAYLAKAAADPANDPIAPTAIRHHYELINATLRALEKQKKEAEPKHLAALTRFAASAYRRPLTPAESQSILANYKTLRSKNELSHEDAIRESIAAILMAPDFLYRFDLLPARSSARPVSPLSPYALASRLSYFLWSSMPDEELLKHAAAGDLASPAVLLAQTRRMLKSPKIHGMATEFTGNWLQFRHFEKSNSVDRQRFPTFNDELRSAMFEEPIRLLASTIAENRPALELLYGPATFVNPALARHYGMPVEPNAKPDQWTRVDNATNYGRGGILPMAVFLTQNSPGLRTSPVKRGNWVVQRVLGEIIPPPPPVVPELPHDEAASERPIREMLAKHRENAVCSACHAKIDSFGLPFEGYGPVGNARDTDLAGRPVDTVANYPNGTSAKGIEGLRNYIQQNRQKDFILNLSRKLLAFSLNRSLQLSDEALIDSMQVRAAAANYRMQSFIEAIVTSSQFLNKRAPVAENSQKKAKI